MNLVLKFTASFLLLLFVWAGSSAQELDPFAPKSTSFATTPTPLESNEASFVTIPHLLISTILTPPLSIFRPAAHNLLIYNLNGVDWPTLYLLSKSHVILVKQLRTLRKHLNINSWVVSGGSWGSTLALAYSQTHPEYCQALILRGIFMLRYNLHSAGQK
jgi:hypothetical protein